MVGDLQKAIANFPRTAIAFCCLYLMYCFYDTISSTIRYNTLNTLQYRFGENKLKVCSIEKFIMTTKRQRTFISIEIDPKTKDAFSKKLGEEGKTVTGALKQFIEDYLSKEESIPNPQNLAEFVKRLEEVEKKVGIENAQLLGESVA